MKISKKSKMLMSFFTKHKKTSHIEHTSRTNHIISELYHHILNAYNYLSQLKQTQGTHFYNITVKKIHTPSQIIRPTKFNSNSFPKEIRKHIDELSVTELCYHFSLLNRNVKLYFIVEEANVELKIDEYNSYVDAIIMWLYVLTEYASKPCASNLVVYFYFTSLEKHLPNSTIEILNENNVNTAFTTTCPKDSEIVVYRKEEWFKVLIHETFHNFGLDFSDMNNTEAHNFILNIFKVTSDVNIYESYTEFWAEIINALFCSFFSLKNKRDIDEFLSNSEFFINFERTYSFFQLVKTLDFMGLNYKNIYSKTNQSEILRKTFYKEKSNVLAYYIIKVILINNYQGFLSWCKINNFSLLQFKKTTSNLKEFCNFIKNNYKTKLMLDNVKSSEMCLQKVKNEKNYKYQKFLLTNMRMSICEMG